ncbi:MAG: RNA methyltransferase [Bacilli bacterium]|nr:RNA methyltransferase [Bacilli bacterium]
MLYSSIENSKIKELKKLKTKKYRDLLGKFIIEGEHLINEANKLGYLEEIYVLEGSNYNIDVKTNYITKEVLKYITDLDTPTIIGVAKKINNQKIGNRIVILDNIQDPGNLGTIIRSSVAFNIDTIVLSNDSVDLYNEKVIRATQGMIFNINIIREDILSFISNIKNDYYIYGTKVNGGNSLKDIEKREKFAIIMGNEGNGMSSELDKLCDSFIYIDMNEKCESLNVGVATSIILYELDK